jgi:N-acyl-D-amino-acid deacylase
MSAGRRSTPHRPRSILVLALLGAASGHAQIPITGQPVASLKPLDDYVVNYMQQFNVVGASLAVTRGGHLIYARGFGSVDVGGAPVQPDTLFRQASISKVITGYAMDRYLASRQIPRSQPILPYLSYLLPAALPDSRMLNITFDQAASFTTGLDVNAHADVAGAAKAYGVPFPPNAFVMDMYALSKPLLTPPGSTYLYTGVGHDLIARFLERMTGRGFEEYVRQTFFVPMGLTRPRIAATRMDRLAPTETFYFAQPRSTYIQ